MVVYGDLLSQFGDLGDKLAVVGLELCESLLGAGDDDAL